MHLPRSWLLCSHPSIHQGVGTQFSRCRDLTRELIFDSLFRLCQIIVSWLQIKLLPWKHFLFQMPPFFSLKSVLYVAWPSPVPLECVKTAPFGKSISTRLSSGLSRFCQCPTGELEKEGRMYPLGFFPSRISWFAFSFVPKHT